MDIHWKNHRTTESATLDLLAWQADDVYINKSQVLGGEMPAYKYPAHELHLMTKGRITTERHSSSGKRTINTAHIEQMCIVPAGQTVSAEWDDGFEMLVIGFAPHHLARMSLEFNGSPEVHLIEAFLPNDTLIQYLGNAILNEHQQPTERSPLYAESIWRTLMLHVMHKYTDTKRETVGGVGKLNSHKIRRATEFIENRLVDDLTIAEVAQTVNLSYFHFIRAFRAAVGITPEQYITRRRLEVAKSLLSNTDLPVIDVCVRAGFKNQSHFTSLFRKRFGVTPTAWRNATRPVTVVIDRTFDTSGASTTKIISDHPGYLGLHERIEADTHE
jgi:AraC family transcriptional regulator